MSTSRNQVTGVIAPPPDDSDFVESENEHDDSQSLLDGQHEISEIEAELGAVHTPIPSQATSIGRTSLHPMPAGKIMQMTQNFSFTYFKHPAPRADTLNRNGGRESAGLPIDPSFRTKFNTRINQDGTTQSEPAPASTIAPHISNDANIHWFCVDDELVYLSFFEDWGPLNVAMFYRFCLHLHHLINSAQEESTASAIEAAQDLHLILYTSNNPKSKANAALLAAMYAMVCGDMTPADAFHPISTLELMAFRDAGYGRADYYLSVQDILYGVNRAIQERLLDLTTFDLEEYETYEQVQNGDWNWITPNIIAFASPNDKEYVAELRNNANGLGRPTTPGLRRPLNSTFQKTLQYFKSHNVKLVVRLNNPLYDSRVFEREGIEHVDMYFDDGSNPCEEILRSFIARADEIISKGGVIAVHCKAGLGRTGVLIGAYLAYKHGFSAGESIGFMRIMRPGCVVGPQQHFMYQEVRNWIRWREQDDAKIEMERALEQQRKELLGKRSYIESISDTSSGEEGTTDVEVNNELGGGDDQRKYKKMKTYDAAPSTPIRESDKGRDDTIRLAKPTPCVGQPRKSPSPTRKRAAQAQAPATIARMGGNGTLVANHRGRIVSADSIRSSGNSSSRLLDLDTKVIPAPSYSDLDVNVDVHVRVNNVTVEHTPLTEAIIVEQVKIPSPSSRVLVEAQRLNSNLMQLDSNNQEKRVLSPSRSDKKYARINTSPSNEKRQRTESVTNDGDLFVEGWQSPEPPSSFMQKIAQSSPTKSVVADDHVRSPTTPTSPSTPNGVHRASPHIRERFGLREAGSNQNTPRSRKETINGSQTALDSGSSQSLSSSGSLTSRDAIGSSDDLTPTLQPGPLESAIKNDRLKSSTSPAIPPSASITAALSSPVKGSSSKRVMSRSREPISRTASNSSAASSSSQKGTRTVARPPSSMASSRPASSVGQRNGTSYSSTTAAVSKAPSSSQSNVKTVQRHASSAANSAGRVAAARERLAQKQAGMSDSNANARKVSGQPNGHARAPSRNGVNSTATNGQRPALASAPSSAVNGGGVRQTSNGTVPRFAMSTAASAAKSAANAAIEPKTINPVATSVISTNIRNGSTNRFTTNIRTGPTPISSSQAARTATMARLHGRNVHRRRSSLGEADIIM